MNTTTVTLPLHEYERLKNYGELVQNREQFCVIEDTIEGRSYVVGRDQFADDCKAIIHNMEERLSEDQREFLNQDMELHRLGLKQQLFEQSIWYKLYKFFNR